MPKEPDIPYLPFKYCSEFVLEALQFYAFISLISIRCSTLPLVPWKDMCSFADNRIDSTANEFHFR